MTTTSTRPAGHLDTTDAAPRPGVRTELTGTTRLLRLAARRDRIVLPVWVGSLAVLLVASVASIVGLYGTEAERTQYAVIAATNVVARAIDGPMSGTSLGAIVMTEVFGIMALLVGIMAVQAIVRHTRAEEETGRAELVGSAVVGRHARLVAGLVVTGTAAMAVGVVTTLTLLAVGLPAVGSVLAGAALAGVGLSFAGVGAITAQVSETARGANTLGIAVVGASFLVRAVGDALGQVADDGVRVVSAWPSWLSPIGWGQQVRPFDADHAGLLVLYLGLVVVTVVVAFVLTNHRDVGSGMLPVRPGPAVASRWLSTPAGLALRLQRASILGWVIGVGVMAVALGAVSDEVEVLLETSEELTALIAAIGGGDALVDLYIAFTVLLLGYAVAAMVVQGVLRARGEELAGRAEPVLATAVGRGRYLGAHLGAAVGGAVLALLVIGLLGGIVAALVTGQGAARVGGFLAAAGVQLPAVLVLGAVAVAASGWLPRAAAALSWGVVAGSLVIGQFGGLFDLPQAVLNLSPFTHLPALPAEELRVLPLVVLLVVAGVIGALGLVGWRRRDLTT